MRSIGVEIEGLINRIARLPSLGPRSAKRIVLHLLKDKEKLLKPFIQSLVSVYDSVKTCPICGNIDVFDNVCSICANELRSNKLICIVETVSDLWAIERSRCFSGKYHVLNCLLSSINGNGPDALNIRNLIERCINNDVNEIIIALSPTVDGQTTDQYIRNFLNEDKRCVSIKKTSLAVGIPFGGELDFMDDSTLFTAFNSRQ